MALKFKFFVTTTSTVCCYTVYTVQSLKFYLKLHYKCRNCMKCTKLKGQCHENFVLTETVGV